MEKTGEIRRERVSGQAGSLAISVIIAVRNEAHNLPCCLDALQHFGEVYVIDSHSTDDTREIAAAHGAKVVQFDYQGGWPKKRQWALDTLPIAYDWVLLLDADEVMTSALEAEIRGLVADASCDGYYVALQMYFLGRQLRQIGRAHV